MKLVRALWHDEEGQDLAEYGIALAVIAGGIASAIVLLSGEISQLWGTAAKQIRQALSGGS
jgi:Flp pilus assembly pilin Flp